MRLRDARILRTFRIMRSSHNALRCTQHCFLCFFSRFYELCSVFSIINILVCLI
ncbi:hypothetical protein Hanom_Chr03g00208651 [Helianthus anomalus]